MRPHSPRLAALGASLLLVVLLSSCGDSPAQPGNEGPAAFRLQAPAQVATGVPFSVTVQALGSGGATLTSFGGTATLSSSAGTLTPTSITLAQGRATAQVSITGASGTVTLRASASGVEGSADLAVIDTDRLLFGEPDDPASTAIPDRPFEMDWESYSTEHPDLPGLPLSTNTVLLVASQSTTLGELNEILGPSGAEIRGGIPGTANAPGILLLRLPTATHQELESILQVWREDPRLEAVSPDVLLAPDWVTRSASLTGTEWTWDGDVGGGNWGHELTRVPQAWNWMPALTSRGSDAAVGILDLGFEPHLDLSYAGNATPARQDPHGTAMAGIIAADVGNGIGTDGLNPRARLWVRGGPFGGSDASMRPRVSWGQNLIAGLRMMLDSSGTRPRIVSISMGYNWYTLPLHPDNDLAAQRLADEQGRAVDALLRQHPDVLIFASAGNDSRIGTEVSATYNSPFTAAALIPSIANPNILVIEAVEHDPGATGSARRWRGTANGSNYGAHLSAPGHALGVPTGTSSYKQSDGTSPATAFAAGVASLLLSLEPGLTATELKDAVLASGVPVSGASNRIDAFEAVLQIDVQQNNRTMLEWLLDIDDGTADGNQRTNPPGSATNYTEEDADQNGRIGDDRVDLSDFRRWRDWYLQLQPPTGLILDGSDPHPKKDVNGDELAPGQEGAADAPESVHPKGDFNGDGVVDRNLTMFVGGIFQQQMTDLEVFEPLFQDPHHRFQGLDTLLISADVTVHPQLLLDLASNGADPEITSVRTSVRRVADDVVVAEREHMGEESNGEGPVQVYTVRVPETDAEFELTAVGLDAANDSVLTVTRTISLNPGQDFFWDPVCEEAPQPGPGGMGAPLRAPDVCSATVIIVQATLPSRIRRGASEELRVRVGIEDGGVVTWGAGYSVSLHATGGTVDATSGTTDADGYFTTFASLADGSDQVTIAITATDPDGATGTASVSASVLVPKHVELVRTYLGAFASGEGTDPACKPQQQDVQTSSGPPFPLSDSRSATVTISCSFTTGDGNASGSYEITVDQDTGWVVRIAGSGSVSQNARIQPEAPLNTRVVATGQLSHSFTLLMHVPVSVRGELTCSTTTQGSATARVSAGISSAYANEMDCPNGTFRASLPAGYHLVGSEGQTQSFFYNEGIGSGTIEYSFWLEFS